MISEQVIKTIKNAPDLPGVYLFKDEKGKILYVGKAKNLKKRLTSYLQTDKLGYRKKIMVYSAKDIEYIVVGTESDALILENNLIKENQPHYNIALKDDKTYPYIKVTIKEEFPRVFITRKRKDDGNLYFGPYPSVKTLRTFLKRLRSIFPYRHCRTLPKHTCLQYHIGRCPAPCEKKITKDEYGKQIKKIIEMLKGNGKELYQRLEKEMKKEAELLNFENAAQLRDQLNGLKQIIFGVKTENSEKDDTDIFAVNSTGTIISIFMMSIKDRKVINKESFIFESSDNETDAIISFVKLFYDDISFLPDKILINKENCNFNELRAFFKERFESEIDIYFPISSKEKSLMRLAKNNSDYQLKRYFINNLDNYFDDLSDFIGKRIDSIDAFDISNYGKEIFVGASIRITRKGFEKKAYRHFNIKSNQQNDFLMIYEIVRRRYKKGDLPSLILIDGGKIQLSFAKKALEELNLQCPILGLAKKEEHIILDNEEIALDNKSFAKMLLMRARDEVHRFGITFNRKKKRKKNLKNPLEEIKGIGKKDAETLLSFFGTIENIKAADISQIIKVPGIGEKKAKKIHDFLKNN